MHAFNHKEGKILHNRYFCYNRQNHPDVFSIQSILYIIITYVTLDAPVSFLFTSVFSI